MALAERVVGANRLLAAFPDQDRRHVASRLKLVSLDREQPVQESQEPINALYFPVSSVISVVQPLGSQDVSEIATVGMEGMVGLPLFLTAGASPWRAFCQVPGDALHLTADALGDIITASSGVRSILGRYCQALFVQIGRNYACNRLHSMPQRCSRWILLVRRQIGRDDFLLTQQSLATMLGVRRATVTVTAGELQQAGLIQYHHGSMRIADPEGLEAMACDCYSAIVGEYDRLIRRA